MAIYLSGGCQDCGPCGGKWQAVVSKMLWYGQRGFTSTAGCGACNYDPDKYLTKQVAVGASGSITSTVCTWTGSAWVRTSGSYSLAGAVHNFKIDTNSYNGTETLSGCSISGGTEETTGGGDTTGCGVKAGMTLEYLGYLACAEEQVASVDIWATLSYTACTNSFFTEALCGGGFPPVNSPSGSKADIEAFWASLGASTIEINDPTATQLKHHVAWDYDYSDATDCPTSPPGEGDPLEIIKECHIHADLSIQIDLSNLWTFTDVFNSLVGLLAFWPLDGVPLRSDPIDSDCQNLPMLRYRTPGEVAGPPNCTWNTTDCSYTPDAGCEPVIVGTYDEQPGFPAVITYGADVSVPYGAWFHWEPAFNAMWMIKWVRREECYNPYGYQIGNPKTWNYMFQTWSVDHCTGDAEYTCSNFIGGQDFLMCISPCSESFVFGRRHNWPTMTGFLAAHGPESNNGFTAIATCKEFSNDSYPGSDPSTHVEAHCSDCPDAGGDCGPPAVGECLKAVIPTDRCT